MPLHYLLDTDILIYVRQRKPVGVYERLAHTGPDSCAISTVSYGELLFGAMKSGNEEASQATIRNLLRVLPVLPLSPPVAEIYASIRAALARSGEIIGPNDLWIAAHAMAEGLVLVTNNEREFRRVRGLKLENWAR